MPTRRAFLRQGLILVTVGAAAPATQGWLGRYLTGCACEDHGQAPAISIGQSLPRAFWTDSLTVPSLSNLEGYRLQPDPFWPADGGRRRQALELLEARHEAL